MLTQSAEPPELAELADGMRASGSPLTVGEMLRLLIDALAEARQLAGAISGRGWFNDEEAEAFEAAGLGTGSLEGLTGDPVAEGAAQTAALWATALRVGEAAEQLSVAPSRIRQRLGQRSLYGVKRGGEWRLPAFQFDDGSPVEGIDKVLRVLPVDMHPVSVWNWFRLPKPELEHAGGHALSPLDWLRAGLPWEAVAVLARAAGVAI